MANMSVKQFVDLGYLQELNRRFLNPLGLELKALTTEDEIIGCFLEIVDMRDELKGGIISEDLDVKKSSYIDDQIALREDDRYGEYGFWIQPTEHADEVDSR